MVTPSRDLYLAVCLDRETVYKMASWFCHVCLKVFMAAHESEDLANNLYI